MTAPARNLGIAIALGVLLSRGSALALSPAEYSTRRQLIEQAKAAHKAGDHPKALQLAEQAGGLQMTTSLRFFIAQEQEETGALADAYGNAQNCAREAELDTKLRDRALLIRDCRAIETRLKGRVSHLVVSVPSRPPGLKVTLLGKELNYAALDVEFPVTPGSITVEATAPNHTPYRLEISVPEGKTINITVSLAPVQAQATEKVAAAGEGCPAGQHRALGGECAAETPDVRAPDLRAPDGAPVTAGTAAPGATLRSGGAPPAAEGRRTDRTVALVAAVGGAVALVGGGVAWLIADSKYDGIKRDCGSTTGCSQQDYDAGRDDVRSLDRIAVGAGIVGGALVVGGLAYYFLTGHDQKAPSASFGIDPVGRKLALGVRF